MNILISSVQIGNIQGVNSHSSMLWPKNDLNSVASVHIRIAEGLDSRLYQIIDQVDHSLKETIKGLDDLTIHVSTVR